MAGVRHFMRSDLVPVGKYGIAVMSFGEPRWDPIMTPAGSAEATLLV